MKYMVWHGDKMLASEIGLGRCGSITELCALRQIHNLSESPFFLIC